MRSWKIKPLTMAVSFSLIVAVMSLASRYTALGEQSSPKVALMRLEDIGPGGEYGTPDQLGKLRAVFDYLREQGVRYQIGVIPKWIDIPAGQPLSARTLDDKNDPFVASFVRVLHDAERGGAVLGMHGYTHQVGETRRDDGHHESGIGNEFGVAGLAETATPAYASERLAAGEAIMRAAGLVPRFWETPHYHYDAAQVATFRSAFGIIYENKPESPRQGDVAVVSERNTAYGAPSFGTVYVPTPFSYIPYNRDDKLITGQLGKTKRLPSFFYHPFLEFKYLQPVTDEGGNAVLRDGLPEYVYPERLKTNLQKLVATFRDKEYTFYSLLDYVPFSPAHSVNIGALRDAGWRLGDATGDGQNDVVAWDDKTGDVTVIAGSFRGNRGDGQAAPVRWLQLPRQKGDLFALVDDNGDGKLDLWVVRAAGAVEAYHSTGSSFVPFRSWPVRRDEIWSKLYALRGGDGSTIVAGMAKDGARLGAYVYRDDKLQPAVPYKWRMAGDKQLYVGRETASSGDSLWMPRSDTNSCFKLELPAGALEWRLSKVPLNIAGDGGAIRFGDFNGDGQLDVMLWREQERTFSVYLRAGVGDYRLLSKFGPWGKPNGKLIVADLDGNGTSDIALAGGDGYLDTALSFESKTPPTVR